MKRYQTVSIECLGKVGQRSKLYNVTIYDRKGVDGCFVLQYHCKSKKRVIQYLRNDDTEVSKHVENGGKLRLY